MDQGGQVLLDEEVLAFYSALYPVQVFFSGQCDIHPRSSREVTHSEGKLLVLLLELILTVHITVFLSLLHDRKALILISCDTGYRISSALSVCGRLAIVSTCCWHSFYGRTD